MNTSCLKLAAMSLITYAFVALAGCGGGAYGGGGGGGGGSGSTYTVGGMVSGLMGSGLVLRDNGGDNLAVSMSGSFTFATKVANGAAYGVTVYTQPTNPTQTCVVNNGAGTMGSSNVTNIGVVCSNTYSVGGTVSGLVGSGLVLNTGYWDYSNLDITMDGPFTLVTDVANGEAYNVVVSTQPTNPAQTCVVTHGSGTMGTSNVTNVAVVCGTGFSVATANGAYLGVGYQLTNDTGSLGTVTYDGSGNFNVSALVANVAGAVAPVPSYSGTYTVANDGVLTASGGGGTLEGGISADGHTLAFAQVTAGQPPSFAVNVKQGQSNFTTANVSGAYRLVSYEDSGTNGNLMTVTFDGAGNFSGSGTRNQSGTITDVTTTGTYTVNPDGSMTLSPTGGTALNGGVSADGNTLEFSQMTAGHSPDTTIAIKQGQTNATNGSLEGTYKLFNYDGSSNNVALLTLVADGAGNVAGTQVLNSAGVITSSAIATTYAVSTDGTVTIANGSDPPLLGYLSADGYTIVATDMHAGDFPAFTVGVRQ